ncbi:MAG: PD-(D/E)XK nuclease domain-containing protein [Clostridiales bacterium]|nr:PD-(D/E)XK nuclease domain-containing protein [Clostridiales bacterium]
MIALMDNQYKIKSNRESGDGRYDISLIPREERYPGIIMELKWKKNLSEDKLTGLADEALAQIDDMRYDAAMKEDGIKDILKFGIAFSGKRIRVSTK